VGLAIAGERALRLPGMVDCQDAAADNEEVDCGALQTDICCR
jgi:hypothetical protein